MIFLGYLRELLTLGRKRFYVDDVECRLSITIQELDRFLIYLINEEVLEPVIQIICPHPHCQVTVAEYTKSPPKDTKFHCDMCELEFTFAEAHTRVAMEFVTENLNKVPFFRARRKVRMANRARGS